VPCNNNGNINNIYERKKTFAIKVCVYYMMMYRMVIINTIRCERALKHYLYMYTYLIIYMCSVLWYHYCKHLRCGVVLMEKNVIFYIMATGDLYICAKEPACALFYYYYNHLNYYYYYYYYCYYLCCYSPAAS